MHQLVVICLKISIFVVSNTTSFLLCRRGSGCDLLENFYLCGIKHNVLNLRVRVIWVVICLKISIFVVSNTTYDQCEPLAFKLWFAWKFLSLWYQTQPILEKAIIKNCCDLLENFYLCGIKHNVVAIYTSLKEVVICLKISIFVVSNTTPLPFLRLQTCCDLLENFYLCGIKHNGVQFYCGWIPVVICLKISIFVVSNTT